MRVLAGIEVRPPGKSSLIRIRRTRHQPSQHSSMLRRRRIIQLGKHGDVINVLPIAREMASITGIQIEMVCRSPYHLILDGVTYAKPVLTKAEKSADVPVRSTDLDTQLTNEKSIPYNLEQWRMAGLDDRFDSMFPEFDNRSNRRELSLVESHINFDRPILLFTLEAESSYMESALRSEIARRIVDSFGAHFQLVDIGKLRASRIYDMLGLFELASALITVDSAMLHLATACEVPVVAMVSNHGPIEWRASATKRNVLFRCNYNEVIESWEQIVESVRSGVPEIIPSGRIVHVVPTFFSDSWEANRRNGLARSSWETLHHGNCKFAPFDCDKSKRKHDCLDGHSLPHLKDCIEFGIASCDSEEDIICFTNTDVVLSAGFGDCLRYHMRSSDFCCSFRMCYEVGERPDFENRTGSIDYGRDMFAFRRSWIRRNISKIPDFFLGMGGWDFAISMWFRSICGRTIKNHDICVPIPECELQNGFVWHESHVSPWTSKHTTRWETARSMQRSLFERFMVDIGMKGAQCRI